MNAAEFKLHQLRIKIAFAVLAKSSKSWQPEIVGRLSCPFCQTQSVFKLMQRDNGNTHVCRQCQRQFSEELFEGCRCWFPGKLKKCQACPRFQALLPVLKQEADKLRSLNCQQLELLLQNLDQQ